MFYRAAGPKTATVIVLLHGFPSSSRMFDTLIPLLAVRYRVIAPDYPGFGQSDAPAPSQYRYTFDHLAQTTDHLLEQLGIGRSCSTSRTMEDRSDSESCWRIPGGCAP